MHFVEQKYKRNGMENGKYHKGKAFCASAHIRITK